MRLLVVLSAVCILGWVGGALAATGSTAPCARTGPDALGPFYEPGAPVRSSVGKGYALTGVVRSSAGCSPIAGARIELWLAGPSGEYDDDHRATVISDRRGTYAFESNVPQAYGGRPPHIHVRASAKGCRTLVTQHYPAVGQRSGSFDLVLTPEP